MCRKEADVKGIKRDLVGGLHRDTFDSYAGINHFFDHSFLAVRNSLKEMFDCDSKTFQQGTQNAFFSAAGDVQNSFVDAPDICR